MRATTPPDIRYSTRELGRLCDILFEWLEEEDDDDDGDRGEEGMREGEGEKGERATGTSHLELF